MKIILTGARLLKYVKRVFLIFSPAIKWILVLLFFAFQPFDVLPSLYDFNTQDSLLIDRLTIMYSPEKRSFVDSLFRADADYALKIVSSKDYIESCKPSYLKQLWQERFIKAGTRWKSPVIDSMFACNEINYDLIKDIFLTEKYKHLFPPDTSFMTFRTRLALKLGKRHGDRIAVKTLSEFYHSGERSRPFDRSNFLWPEDKDNQWDMTLQDSSGAVWAIKYSRRYPDSLFKIWLAVKKPASDSWQGPWFTGLYGKIPLDELSSYLRFFSDLPYLKNNEDQIFYLVSPDYLMKDQDRDGLYDEEEIAFGTDPRRSDTDGDGLNDNIDINPLAQGIENPSDRDLAVRAALKLSTNQNNPVNIYVLKGAINSQMEYFTNSPNAMFLPDRTQWNSSYKSDNFGGIPVIVSVIEQNESFISVSVRILTGRNREESNIYVLKKHFSEWIVYYSDT